jgi:hypothetical protein
MKDNETFALVPIPSSALEKAESVDLLKAQSAPA